MIEHPTDQFGAYLDEAKRKTSKLFPGYHQEAAAMAKVAAYNCRTKVYRFYLERISNALDRIADKLEVSE